MIKEIQIYGERNSGTNYIAKLVRKNFKGVEITNKFGWKHGELYQAPKFYKPDAKEITVGKIRKPGNKTESSTLFIVMFRNPFTWLQSMHNQPHHAPYSWYTKMDEFLKIRWQSFYSEPGQPSSRDRKYALACATEENKFEDYENIMKLRTDKLAKHLSIHEKVPNVCYVNYEQLAKDPDSLLQDIAEVYGIKTAKALENITEDKFGGKKYKKKNYAPISFEMLQFVVNELDWEMENKVGYKLDEKKMNKIQLSRPSANWLMPWNKQKLDVDDPSVFLNFDFKPRYFKDSKEVKHA